MVGRRITTALLAVALGLGTTAALSGVAGAAKGPDFSKLKHVKEPSPCKNDPGITDDTIKIGVISPKSGPSGSSYAPSTENGIKARIDAANSSGELGTRHIELVSKDDQGNTANNSTAAQQLVEDDQVFAIIEVSSVADGSAKYLNDNKIPVAGWHNGVRDSWGIYPNMFSWRNSQPPDPTKEFTSRNADVMKALGAKKVAVVGSNIASSAIFINQAATAVENTKGLKLVYKTTDITPEQEDFTGVAAQIKDSKADGVYTGLSGLQANGLSQAIKQAGINLKAIVFPGGYDSRVLALPGYEGAYMGTEFKPLEVGSPGLTAYEDAMRANGNEPENFFAIQGYFSADVLVEGIKEAGVGCPTRKAFITNLRLVKGYDAGGSFVPVDYAEIFGRIFYCVYYVQIQNKQFVPIFNGEPFCAKNIFENGKKRKLKPSEVAKG
jgi:ABC-type branched-subunit amino acid transport system substrate-binding protein